MIRFTFGILLMVTMWHGVTFAQGSTGRRFKDPNYLVTRTVSEAIVSIDLNKSELVMRDFDGKAHTVKVDRETKFTNPEARTLVELKAGQRIRLTYRAADSLALEIYVLAVKKPQ